MQASLQRHVRSRASGRCEYCRLPQEAASIPFEIDHVIARKHGGATVAANPALACWYCNSFKGSDLAGIDPRSKKPTRLFHPRRHLWERHFRWNGPELIGRTSIGRTTLVVLQIHSEAALTLRQSLIDEGLFEA